MSILLIVNWEILHFEKRPPLLFHSMISMADDLREKLISILRTLFFCNRVVFDMWANILLVNTWNRPRQVNLKTVTISFLAMACSVNIINREC